VLVDRHACWHGVATIIEEIITMRGCCGKRHKNVTDSRERSRRCLAECGTERKRERNDGQEIDNGGGGQRERGRGRIARRRGGLACRTGAAD